MKFKNNYYILRHGQTIYQTQEKKIIYPPPELDAVALTAQGRRQIARAGHKLKEQNVDVIYASNMLRTRQTAEIVAKALRIKKINFSKRLRDISFGVYQGRRKEEFYRHFPRHSKKRFSKAPKKGESWAQAQKRVLDFLKEINKKHHGKRILIISHGDPLWLLQCGIKKLSQKKMLKGKEINYIKVGELRKLL